MFASSLLMARTRHLNIKVAANVTVNSKTFGRHSQNLKISRHFVPPEYRLVRFWLL